MPDPPLTRRDWLEGGCDPAIPAIPDSRFPIPNPGYFALIASAGRPPLASLRLASASSDAVAYGPMRTR